MNRELGPVSLEECASALVTWHMFHLGLRDTQVCSARSYLAVQLLPDRR